MGRWRDVNEGVLVTFPGIFLGRRSRGRGRCVWMEMVTY